MAWNGSGNSGRSVPKTTSNRKQKLNLVRLTLLAGLLGLCIAFILVAIRNKPEPVKAHHSPKVVSKQTLQPKSNKHKSEYIIEAPQAPVEAIPLPPQKVGETRDGYILLGSGKLHKVNGVITNDLQHTKSKYSIFKHRSENEIARLLFLKPGDNLIGTPNYSALKDDFLNSLNEKILINPDDTEEIRLIKQNVIEAKANLKAAHDRGEDIAQIMLDARKECQELARYKRLLTQNIFEALADDPDSDVDSYIEAANKMLEEKGIAPLHLGPISRVKFQMEELQ